MRICETYTHKHKDVPTKKHNTDDLLFTISWNNDNLQTMSTIQIDKAIVLIKQAIADVIGYICSHQSFLFFFFFFLFFILFGFHTQKKKKEIDLPNVRRLQNNKITVSLESAKNSELAINGIFWAGLISLKNKSLI